jgi:hypothetical protein
MHGWGITMHIQQISDQVLQVEEGLLYPALHRMEQEDWIVAEWGMSDNNHARATTGSRLPAVSNWLQKKSMGEVDQRRGTSLEFRG